MDSLSLISSGPEIGTALSEPEEFSRLYDEHAAGVYAAAYRILRDDARAQEVAHDVFLALWHEPHRFDAARGQFGSYLRLMARSRAVDVWRRGQTASRAHGRVATLDASLPVRAEDSPAESAERTEQAARVRAAIARLPESQRETIVLAYWGELTAEQVARRVGIPLGTAKSRIRMGLLRLRTELETGALAAVPTLVLLPAG
jgi:RNA polymerase sigma-70 factor (ECF subfamily)